MCKQGLQNMAKETIQVRMYIEDYKTLKEIFEPQFRKTNPDFKGNSTIAFLLKRAIYHACDMKHKLEYYG